MENREFHCSMEEYQREVKGMKVKNRIGKSKKTREEKIQDLKSSHPCPSTWLEVDYFSNEEAVLVYHGVNPDFILGKNEKFILSVIELLDAKTGLYKFLTHSQGNHKIITPVKLHSLIIEKGLFIPEAFSQFKNSQNSSPAEVPDIKKLVKEFDLKKLTPNELGIIFARVLAAVRWKNDSSFSISDILNDPEFEGIMRSFYTFASISGGDDREFRYEWISDLDPRTSKQGRKKKERSF